MANPVRPVRANNKTKINYNLQALFAKEFVAVDHAFEEEAEVPATIGPQMHRTDGPLINAPRSRGLKSRAARREATRREVSPVDSDDDSLYEPEVQIPKSKGKRAPRGRVKPTKTTRRKSKAEMPMEELYKELKFERTIQNGRMYIVDDNGRKSRKFPVKPEDSGAVMSFMTKWHDKGGGVAKNAPSLQRFLKNHKDALALRRERDEWDGLDM